MTYLFVFLLNFVPLEYALGLAGITKKYFARMSGEFYTYEQMHPGWNEFEAAGRNPHGLVVELGPVERFEFLVEVVFKESPTIGEVFKFEEFHY